MTAGTGALLRLALRLDRVRLSVWVLLLATTPAATAAQYIKLYPTQQSLDAVGTVLTNPSLVAINGRLLALSLGGLTAWKIGVTEFILIGLMSVFTVVRHTRAEEETGRQELVSAGVVGRFAPLTAALLTVALANVAIAVLVALTLLGVGLAAGGAIAFGLATGLVGLLFAGVAAVAVQVTVSARTATGIAVSVLGAAYLLRAVGDTGPGWLSWISPIGWGIQVRSFAGERWDVLALIVAVAVVLTATSYALVARRDVGAGLVAARPGPADGARWLRSPAALAFRLQRGVLAGWIVALAVSGAALGGAANGIAHASGLGSQMSDMLTRLGGHASLVDTFLAACFGILGFVAAGYTVQATMRLRAEESGGRVEPLLATRVGRTAWVFSHVAYALLGTAVLLAVAGATAGLAYGAQIGDVGGQVTRGIGGALAQVPAAWVLAGLGVALFGLAPKLSALTWAVLIGCAVLLEVGALFGLDQRIVDVSPFAHVPKLPGAAFTVTPLLWLTGIAAVLTAAGLIGFRRRDIG